MSISRNKKRKAAKFTSMDWHDRENRDTKRRINAGELPRFHFAKNADGTLEKVPHKRKKYWKVSSWRTLSTYSVLKQEPTKKES